MTICEYLHLNHCVSTDGDGVYFVILQNKYEMLVRRSWSNSEFEMLLICVADEK